MCDIWAKDSYIYPMFIDYQDRANIFVKMDFEDAPSSPAAWHAPSTTSPRVPYKRIRSGSLQSRKRGRSKSIRSDSPPESQHKPSSSRSKTGCMTCRRRKKKCDEAKPTCNNCDKNNIECEGYSEKTVWRSSKSSCACKAAERFPLEIALSSLPSIHLGLEEPFDKTILSHFVQKLSWQLTLPSTHSNPFLDLVAPLAFNNDGLMHGILALSASHLYGTETPNDFHVLERQHYHLCAALKCLQEDLATPEVQDPTMALIMVMYLLSKTEGDVTGMYRWHLNTFRNLLEGCPETSGRHWVKTDVQLAEFLIEFHRYHEIYSFTAPLDKPITMQLPVMEETNSAFSAQMYRSESERPRDKKQNSATIGVLDGLDQLIVQTHLLRMRVRARLFQQQTPAVNYKVREAGIALEQLIHDWNSGQEKETVRWYLAEVHKLACWVDLFRVLHAENFDVEQYHQGTALNLSVPLSPRTRNAQRQKLWSIIDEALELVNHLPANCACHSFLLAPMVKLGCSAVDESHRRKIRDSLENIRRYTGMGNVKLALELLERVWGMMDSAGTDSSVGIAWDIEDIMASMNYDFLIV